MSRTRLTLLFLLVLILALAVAKAMADNEVTITCEIEGNDKDGFKIIAINHGDTDKHCTATCRVTKKDGSKQSWEYKGLVAGKPGRQTIGGEGGVSGAPLTNPEITSESCK
jgi:hypothetical protein